MKRIRNDEGATLVELMVSITIGTLITLAALTVLLLGFRVNLFATETVGRQQTAQMVLTLLQNLATEGEITKLDTYESGDWKVSGWDGVSERVFLSYSKEEGTVYTGDGAEKQTLLDGVTASDISLEGRQLFHFSIENQEGKFSSSVCCRSVKAEYYIHKDNDTVVDGNKPGDQEVEIPKLEETEESRRRNAFLRALSSQIGSNEGLILKGKGYDTGDFNFFSEWYIGKKGYENAGDWSPATPWCGCFIAWGLSYVTEYVATPYPDDPTKNPKWFANVDDFMKYFKPENHVEWLAQTPDGAIPTPGDLVFFNFKNSDPTDPSHMGAVLKVTGEYVYTIEGNTADTVAVRQYALDDQAILGYGILNWNAKAIGG